MKASEAIERLGDEHMLSCESDGVTHVWLDELSYDEAKAIADLIERQAKEIESLNNKINIMINPENLPHQWCPVDSCLVVRELKEQARSFCKDCPQFEDDYD